MENSVEVVVLEVHDRQRVCEIEKMVVHDIEQYVEERVVLDVHYGLQCVVEKTVVLEV